MNLYLMRHAIAAEPDEKTEDSQRSLTEKGHKKLVKIARNLEKLELEIDLILTSSYLRAYQTATIVADALEIRKKFVLESENLTPLGFSDKLVDEINLLAGNNPSKPVKNLFLVGHQPSLGQLIGMLIAGDASLSIELKKAGLCKLSIEQLTYGRCATLEWLMTPAQLTAI
jgi:phosphohistidine phosphatase